MLPIIAILAKIRQHNDAKIKNAKIPKKRKSITIAHPSARFLICKLQCHFTHMCVCGWVKVCVYASECVCVHNANACVKYKKNDNVCVRFN